MEGPRRRGGRGEEGALALFEQDFGGLGFGPRYELQATRPHTRASLLAAFPHFRVKSARNKAAVG